MNYFTNAFNKVEDVADYIKENGIKELNELKELNYFRKLKKKDEEMEAKKKNNTLIWVLAIIGTVVVIGAIAFVIYKFLVPDYLEDFDDDFEDLDDDFFEDDDLTDWKDDAVEVDLKKESTAE